ncbi:MAG: imidazoleglycerol-phosphate dehydratase [Planctomycetota bacterium]|nr:imidazoleglycerol-phosphate dehydratase [Planctomycetota bacterium]
MRRARIDRKTNETRVKVELDLDGAGRVAAKTPFPFLDHLVASFGKHALIDIKMSADSLDGIAHHLVEDVAIALGTALDKSLGKRDRIRRFGHAIVPMDDTRALAALDLVRRPYRQVVLKLERQRLENLHREDIEHFFRSLAEHMCACVHVVVQCGSNDHHKAEAAVKALAIALRQAAETDRGRKGPATTKGVM